MNSKVNIFWFRRDLRLTDNTGLYAASNSPFPILPIFIFDTDILDYINNKADRRVDYIHQALTHLNIEFAKYESSISTFYSNSEHAFQQLVEQYDIAGVYCNVDYEPQAIERDKKIKDLLAQKSIPFLSYKDQVIFEKDEICKDDKTPYTIYTPYAKKWRATLTPNDYQQKNSPNFHFVKAQHKKFHTLNSIGFQSTDLIFKPPLLDEKIIREYDKYRNYPALQKTTQLGIALRFGTISIRQCVEFALEYNAVWLSELIWREFFMQILFHFPFVVHQSFKRQYDLIEWRNNESEFERWKNGETGYPIVDAGMKQLNATGYMHNRVRMIVASFLCKHLLIDWRWGESYFAELLNDYDLSANNGNWQWAAGCGCDAAPYFRIFNPRLQTQKFDHDLVYIKQWNGDNSTKCITQIVEHEFARKRVLTAYQKALKGTL